MKEYDQVDTHLVSSPLHITRSNAKIFPRDILKECIVIPPPNSYIQRPTKDASYVETKSTPYPFERTPKKPSDKPTPFQFERNTPYKGYAMVNQQNMRVHR
mmetsp:Transcript_4806/g.10584  ORF Transcript_4806/g.10584 Transcript_4806/m.10584 type:complete len:101 (+) Transcript_4806:411-713(+)